MLSSGVLGFLVFSENNISESFFFRMVLQQKLDDKPFEDEASSVRFAVVE